MTEATLSITNPEEILALFGPRDQHLRKLRRLFDVNITQRDGRIRISGEDEDVHRATRTLEKLRHLSRKKGELSAGDVDTAASEEGAVVDGTAAQIQMLGDEINIQHAGRRIKPRTPGQAKYVEAIRSHDLTFATGPAGCGKTYLAVAAAVEALKGGAAAKNRVGPARRRGGRESGLPARRFAGQTESLPQATDGCAGRNGRLRSGSRIDGARCDRGDSVSLHARPNAQ